MKSYKGDFLNQIAFPLGGIGSGSISVAGNGMLVNPEINNRPNRDIGCEYSGFGVRAERDGKVLDAKMLFGDKNDCYTDISHKLSGFKHFDNVEFCGEFPFAEVKLSDSSFPATAVIEAFNPFIPSNEKDSSIPAAFFNITLTNTSDKKTVFSVFQNMTNLLNSRGQNTYFEKENIKGITLSSAETDRSHKDFGNITISTDFPEISHTDYWFRGEWFDAATMFKNEFTAPGKLKNRVYDTPNPKNAPDTATLCARAELSPGESITFKFLISWFVPNANCWCGDENQYDYKNYYSTIFDSSVCVADYCFKNWDKLYRQTKLFARCLYSSSLPDEVKDAISGNIAILKSTTCLRLEDGSFWAWEGVWKEIGSCPGTCQHVYNYAYALPFLFPKLEKGIRDNEIKACLEDDGKMQFRMPISLKREDSWRACVDGQMGFIIKCYREWKLSGDNEWLKNSWEAIKNCLAYAWSDDNPDKWDPEKSGVICGRQHHTLDVELFGMYAWLTGMYHGALSAAAEMAEFFGEHTLAAEYGELFRKGQKILDEETFNGEYFVQALNVEDKAPIVKFTENEVYHNITETETEINKENCYYWDDESKQSKYQIESGCEIDQVLADWHADLCGLPKVFNQEHRKTALKSIYKYNFVSMHDLINPCRVFACNDEKGLVICTWPEGVRKPAIPIPYSEECMTGFEYACAANMLQCGMEKEALEIVRSVRQRYDGKRRNPFAEIECGSSYGRAMASYSFLLIYSGFKFDMPNKTIGFKPLKDGTYFWSVDGAWGNVSCNDDKWIFSVKYGILSLNRFITNLKTVSEVVINDKPTLFDFAEGILSVNADLNAGDTLKIHA